jgi:hypothetical protein
VSTTESPAATYYATLVRGRVYYLGNREFLTGVREKVSADDKKWLEQHAVDEVTVEGEGEHQKRAKFKFEVAREGEEPEPPSSPRARSR